MVQRRKLLLFLCNRLTLIEIPTWLCGLFPLRFLTMTLKLIHHCVNVLGCSPLEQCIPEYSLSESEQAMSSSDTCSSQELFYSFEQCSAGYHNSMSTSEDYLGFHCHGQSLICDHSVDDHSGLLSHGWSPSPSGLSGSMGHNKPTKCYDSSGSSGHEVSQKVFSQSSIDVIPLNGIGLV